MEKKNKKNENEEKDIVVLSYALIHLDETQNQKYILVKTILVWAFV